ncbi:MAG: PhoH family protein [Bacteroidales bacterium]|nr:PhoH family protein [Bacteroidales bacterium]
MIEKNINLKDIDQREFFSVNEKNLSFIETLFENLTISVRSDTLKVKGDESEVENFVRFFQRLKDIYKKIPNITGQLIMAAYNDEKIEKESDAEVLIYGSNGQSIKARTKNQQKMAEEIEKKDMLFAIGPAGSGKTYTAVALAVKYLKEKRVKRIILTRPAVEAGENLGFLPGGVKDKLDPYLQPLYDALRDMLTQNKLDWLIENHTIEIAPLAFMRGRTLENSFVILDEAQNATKNQLKMFLTRMGNWSKFIITGDPTQVDLPGKQTSGLMPAIELLKNIKGLSVITLNDKDIVRNPLVTKIVNAFDKDEKNEISQE